MRRQQLQGSCASTFFYDMGGAHNKPVPKSLEDFANEFINIGNARTNMCVTNLNQRTVRKYLKELGWTEATHTNCGLIIHTISGRELTRNLEPYREARRKALEEKRKKEALERQKRLEEQRARAAEILEKGLKAKTGGVVPPPYANDLRNALRELGSNEIYAVSNWWGDRVLSVPNEAFPTLEMYYGVKLPGPNTIRDKSTAEIARKIRRQLLNKASKVAGQSTAK